MENGKRVLVMNCDNNPLFSDPQFKGYYVDEVNGAGAEEVPNYVPTKHELLQLVRYWYRRILENDFFRFQYGGSDSKELRIGRFAPRRIRRAAAIGQEAVDQAIEAVRAQFKAKVGDDQLWNVFENGTNEQWQAVRDQSWREVLEQYSTGALAKLEQVQNASPGSFVAMVLRDPDDKRRPVLVSPGDSQLNCVVRVTGKFEIETDISRIRTFRVDERFNNAGLIRGTRLENGEWRFEFPDSDPHTPGRLFLESVSGEIRTLLHAKTAWAKKHE